MPARILIVEDEQIIAADLRNKLRQLGHDVVGMAIAGEEAIAAAEEVRPDLVLMDVQLEGEMSGTEAARLIQERTGAQVIFVTAFPGVFLRDPAQMTEPGICLGKPFSRVQLEAAVGAAFKDVTDSRKSTQR
jgi:two-component system, response regulator PdtaR